MLLAARPDITVHAADLDAAAVACARRNLGPRGTVHHGDLYEPLPRELAGRVDVLVANAPYVPTAEIALMPPEARLHEPRVALDGGPDGLDVARRIVADARPLARPDRTPAHRDERAPGAGAGRRRAAGRADAARSSPMTTSPPRSSLPRSDPDPLGAAATGMLGSCECS